MFDLDAAIRTWREELTSLRSLSNSDLDELEDHVCCAYGSLVGRGVEPRRAWALARGGLGAPATLSAEFRKAEGTMWRRLLTAGWAMFVLSFLLPVDRNGVTLFHTTLRDGVLPGIQAFLIALRYSGALGAASALTNLAMPLTMWRIRDRGRTSLLALMGAAVVAFLLNASWLVSADPITDLRAGYFLWWSSFGLVATGLALRARAVGITMAPVPSS